MAAAAEHSNASSGNVEEPYDMIDDLSEISNDDHETASIGSNDQEHGLMTPNLESDVEDSVASLGIHSVADLASSTQSFMLPTAPYGGSAEPTPMATTNMPNPLAEVKSANDLIDSYTSEDLDTPRQSMTSAAFQSTWRQALHRANTGSSPKSPQGALEEDQPSKRILFIAAPHVSRHKMDIILTQVTAGMSGNATAADTLTVSRLPATPSGIKLPSTTVVTSEHRIAAVVEHCVGLETHHGSSVQLMIRDAYGTHLQPLLVAENAGVDLNFPDIIVIYAWSLFHLDSLDLAETLAFFKGLPVPKVVVADLETTMRRQGSDGKALPCTLIQINGLEDASQACKIAEEVSTLHFDNLDRQQVEQVREMSVLARQKARPVQTRFNPNMFSIAFALLGLAMAWVPYLLQPVDPAKIVSQRREALSVAVAKAIDISIADSKACDIEHLIPELPQGCASTVIFGRELIAPACATDVRFQSINPNHILISLPGQRRFPSTSTAAAKVWRHDNAAEQLHFNLTQLIAGVYSVSLDPSEAYGPIHVNLLTRGPQLNITLAHHFGSRILHRQTYQDVGTEVREAVVKDVAVMRHAAKSLTEKLTVELAAGLRATQNVTTSLALSAVQDLQAVAKTAGALLRKSAAAGNETMAAITKELVVLQKELLEFARDARAAIQEQVEEVTSNSKASVREPLKESKAKLAQLRRAAQGRVEETIGHKHESHHQNVDKAAKRPKKQPAVAAIASLTPVRDASSSSSSENLHRALNRAERKLAAMQRRYALEEEKSGPERLGKKALRQLRKEIRRQEGEVQRAGRAVGEQAR